MLLPKGNNFLIKALRQRIGKFYPSIFVEKRSTGKLHWQVARYAMKLTQEETQAIAERKREERKEHLRQHRGFRSVWEMVLKAKVPLVVHNGLFDVLFMVCTLESHPLPNNVYDFKALLKKAFANLDEASGDETAKIPMGFYDTKLLAEQLGKESLGADNTSVGCLVKQLKLKECKQPEPFDGYTKSDARFHEAAYDAYQTGRIFDYVVNKTKEKGMEVTRNSLHINRSIFDFCINEQRDKITTPGDVRILDGFHTTYNNSKLLQDLKPMVNKYGLSRSAIDIKWIDDTSLLLITNFPDSSEQLRNDFNAHLDTLSHVFKWKWMHVLLEEKELAEGTDTEPLKKKQRRG